VKYIALLAMVKIVPSHPHLVAEYQDTILASVDDQDISIRMRALDLVSAMVRASSAIGHHLLTSITGQQRQSSIHSPTSSNSSCPIWYIFLHPADSSPISCTTHCPIFSHKRQTYHSINPIACLPSRPVSTHPRHMLSINLR
jgi:hypothetical protein